MSPTWTETIPVLDDFTMVADGANYVALPDAWSVGICDVVNSTGAIQDGRYKAVNLAGAAAISAVTNALGGDFPLFVFGGDGAHFAVSPEQTPTAADALSRAATWARRDLDLELRAGMTTVSVIRAAGFDVRVALFRASEHVRYAMFMGGGLEWAEAELKAGLISLPPSEPQDEPDLTGLSCQWGPIRPQHDKIVSLIVKRTEAVSDARFIEITAAVIEVLEAAAALNPVPAAGPEVRWPSAALRLQSSIAHRGRGLAWRRARTVAGALIAWLVFKLGLRIGSFNAAEYRREIAANTDFRKFDDALMMTVDCSRETIAQLKSLLQQAEAAGEIRFGLHMQDEALMTCVVPSVQKPDHFHFVDGGGGGYTSAARQIKE